MTPSERAREIAEAIFTEWQASCARYPEGYPSPMGPIVERHITAALTIPPGHVRDEHGVDFKVVRSVVVGKYPSDCVDRVVDVMEPGQTVFICEAAEAARGGGK